MSNPIDIQSFSLRFSLYGAVIMGPTMYVWVRTAAKIFPRSDFRSSLSKAITEQFSVDPMLIVTFLFVMSLLEQKTVAEASTEVSYHHLHDSTDLLFAFFFSLSLFLFSVAFLIRFHYNEPNCLFHRFAINFLIPTKLVLSIGQLYKR